jgi:DNA-directed RNA polymerase specialized sigma24 family protein
MPPTFGRVNAASTATPASTRPPRAPYRGADGDPLCTDPIRPSGDAGDGWGRAAAYDAYADGLHTYAIWSLRDHDAAVDALYCSFVMADRHATQLRQPEQIHPWLYAIVRHECHMRGGDTSSSSTAPSPVSGRLRPPGGSADPDGSLAALERNLRRAEFHSLEWPESEGLAPAHKEILELTIRHGLDSQGLGLVLGLGQSGRAAGLIGSAGSQGFGVLADAWRELERSLAAVAVAKGPREHCAQLAELTFGWSGKLTAALRAPLTDHVDSCTRCQHYLHTVIGTPAAPTILPFVAAPRALREILLGELHDPKAARAAGVDYDVIAQRLEHFTPDGFPACDEPATPRRRSGRRAQDRPRQSRPTTQPRSADPRSAEPSPEDEPLLHRTTGTSRPHIAPITDPGSAADTVYRAPGSWAARVLPAQDAEESARQRRPIGPVAAAAADRLTATHAMGAYDVPGGPVLRDERGPRHGASGAAHASDARQRPTFIATPSGRFAVHTPSSDPDPLDSRIPAPDPSSGPASSSAAAAPTAPLPRVQRTDAQTARFATPAAEPPRGADGKPRARHKSRPVRQAVTSAVALGAVGAVAAVSAVLLGLTSENSPQAVLGDPGVSLPIKPTADAGGLTVSVSTAPAATESAVAHAGSAPPPGAVVPVSRDIGQSSPAAATSPPGQPPAANPADFHVSVNQRSGDPNTIVILLRNSGPTSIAWIATAQYSWIALSQSSGTLGAGQSLVVTASATSAAPAGQWTSQVDFAPSGTVLTIHGGTADTPPPGTTSPGTTPPPSESPSPPPTRTPAPTPTPTGSSSSPGGTGPSPSAVRQSGTGGTPSASDSAGGHPTSTSTPSESGAARR